VLALRELIRRDITLVVPGIVAQEVLAGIVDRKQFEALLERLLTFTIDTATLEDHLSAARLVNVCRLKGFTLSAADALIVAQTLARDAQLFTLDRDFERAAPHVRLSLFKFENP
jgi:predicted nucleic acid-binding protein